ncbi:hypothetical protein SAMN04515671_1050 [Nakamurella panacisegetis]|uniref:Lysylphosphatidylglycerol synthase TM region n=1 Tax=Nakamurella panacisegetis TaxID=1090615 RepID=A0A1H0JUN4_9ACTN|nr:lysylphosphatidylglycerol synthase transmembrane domain-containing protein [Nakamurella panacisegetis]SDO47357.1 hypothetical protein SAMN04515671_1050 [Nakamurella panacisegetis]
MTNPVTEPRAAPGRSGAGSATARRTVLVGIGLGAALVALVVWQHDRLDDLPRVLGDANWVWIAAAIAFQAISVAGLARLQRRLLNVDGRHHPLGPILATTYAGNAISQSLPIVGSAASAVFAYRRFLHIGAEKAVAAWALAVAGLYSTITFVTLSAVGALLTGSIAVAVAGLSTLLIGVFPVVALLSGLHRPRVRALVIGLLAFLLSPARRLLGRPSGDTLAAATATIEQIAGLRLTRRDALMAGRFALLNWTADIACLVGALAAVGAPIPWHGLVLAWAAGAGASSLGLTPGGLGVVEAALSLALVAAGLPLGLAVSGVLLYRFIKLWLVVAAGVVALLVIRARVAEPVLTADPERAGAASEPVSVLEPVTVLDRVRVPSAPRSNRLPIGAILGASSGVTFPGVTYGIDGFDPVVVTTPEASRRCLVRPCA